MEEEEVLADSGDELVEKEEVEEEAESADLYR